MGGGGAKEIILNHIVLVEPMTRDVWKWVSLETFFFNYFKKKEKNKFLNGFIIFELTDVTGRTGIWSP